MIRTQIYLTEQQRFALNKLSSTSGKKQSELIREAVDTLIFKLNQKNRKAVLDRIAGIWKDSADLLNNDKLRHTLDRNFSL